jgi:hypothetical protein
MKLRNPQIDRQGIAGYLSFRVEKAELPLHLSQTTDEVRRCVAANLCSGRRAFGLFEKSAQALQPREYRQDADGHPA